MRVALFSTVYMHRHILLKASFPRSRFQFPQKVPFFPLRQLTYTSHLRQNDSSRRQKAQDEVRLRPERSESIKPESYQEPNKAKSAEVPKTDALLAEQTVSNKEQRRADWIIIKEMAKYIWPKVWSTHRSQSRQKLNDKSRMILERKLE
ncbi:hypothetical protein BDR22DRAFT_858586 [Usnea florida]